MHSLTHSFTQHGNKVRDTPATLINSLTHSLSMGMKLGTLATPMHSLTQHGNKVRDTLATLMYLLTHSLSTRMKLHSRHPHALTHSLTHSAVSDPPQRMGYLPAGR